MLDAGVNGGVDMYKSAFFDPEFVRENPAKKESVTKLKEALNEQVDILDKGKIYQFLSFSYLYLSHYLTFFTIVLSLRSVDSWQSMSR